MSANFTQFKDILGDLWSKVRIKVNEISNDYVSKSKKNTVKNTSVFEDIRIVDNSISTVNNLNATTKLGNNSYFSGSPSLSVTANSYSSYLLVGVHEDIEIGSVINLIKIAVVDKATNEIKKIITSNGTAIVRKNIYGKIRSEKVILYPIQETFDTEVYFIVGFNGMKIGVRSENYWVGVYDNRFSVGTRLSTSTAASIPQYCLFGEEVNLIDKANLKLSNTFTGSNRFDGDSNFEGRVDITGVATIKYNHRAEEWLNEGDNQSNSNGYVHFNRNIYIPKGAYATTLDIRVADNVEVGTQIHNVYVWAVTKLNEFSSERIREVIVREGSYTVRELEGYGKGIYLNLNREFSEDTYFMIGQKIPNGHLLIATDNEGDIRHSFTTFSLGDNTNLSTATAENRKIIYKVNIEEVKGLQEDLLDLKDNTIKTSEVGNEPNKIPRLNSTGKLVDSVIPSGFLIASNENNFTSNNDFKKSPTVTKLFTRKSINNDITGTIDGYPTRRYFAELNEKYTNDNNKVISHVLLPIKNSMVGDNVIIDYFMFNNNGQIIGRASSSENCTVIDEQITGCYCAKVPVNTDSGNNGIGFGFMLYTENINGRAIFPACQQHTGNNNAYTSQSKPNMGTTLSKTDKIKFPYKICYETTSELVTRFELENVTQIYPRLVGEYRSLAYETDDVFEEDGHTWLRANGQAISEDEYPELYKKMNPTRVDEPVELPSIENQIGYYYICAK